MQIESNNRGYITNIELIEIIIWTIFIKLNFAKILSQKKKKKENCPSTYTILL